MTKTNKSIKTFSQHLDKRYGKKGTKKRIEFELKARLFATNELITKDN